MKKTKKSSSKKECDKKKYPYDDLGVRPQPLPMPIIPAHEMQIDKGIERLVRVLRYNSIQTTQSCQGGEGHISKYAFVRYEGTQGDGLRGLSIAIDYGFPVMYLLKRWRVEKGEIADRPRWEIVLFPE